MSPPLPLDHIVFAVPDLEDAIAQVEKQTGVCARLGGRHDDFGSHNAILPLEDETYLELIALDPENPAPPQPAPFGLADLCEARLVTWAVRSRNIDPDTTRSKARGYDTGLTLPASRSRPDGARLEWKLTFRPEPFGDGLVPFVIDWLDAPHPARLADWQAPRCTLRRFDALHPRPGEIRAALDALGVRLTVSEARIPALRATIEGPSGSLELR
jgi:hypothetical protein